MPQVALAIEAPGRGDKMSNKILKLYTPKVKNLVPMPSAYDRAAILQGLEGVTAATDGTAYDDFENFPLDKYPVAGKTGTAQVDSYCEAGTLCGQGDVAWPAYKQDTSVFASFAPADDPRFAVDAVFEQSGYGADVAAPAVEQEYTTLFGLNKPAHAGCAGAGTTTTSAPSGAAATTTTSPACSGAAATTTTAPGTPG